MFIAFASAIFFGVAITLTVGILTKQLAFDTFEKYCALATLWLIAIFTFYAYVDLVLISRIADYIAK